MGASEYWILHKILKWTLQKSIQIECRKKTFPHFLDNKIEDGDWFSWESYSEQLSEKILTSTYLELYTMLQ